MTPTHPQDAPTTADFGVVMSTMSRVEAADPDRNLLTSFVAMADGVLPDKTSSNSSSENTRTTNSDGSRTTDPVPTATTTESNTDSNDTETLHSIIGRTPINEFTHLPKILGNAFPMEFPFGVTTAQLGSTGTVLKRVLRRLTRIYDGRVSHNYMLLMYMANLVYRHAGLASTSARVDNDCSDEVIRIINDPDWKERSQTVMSNPTGPEAKKLIKEISPLVRLAGKRVPWSPMERLTASHHIYALYHTFGAPAYFITFAPKTLTNQLMLTFGEMQNPEENHVSLTLPQHLQRRVQLLTSNTVAQARAYQVILDAVTSILFGIKSESNSKKTHEPQPGLFGVPTAYYGVTECQSRHALHAHFVLWLRTMHPEMLQRIAHDDELRSVLINAVDSVVSASTEHFEQCTVEKTVVCKFTCKPYGIRYEPTPTSKGVQLKSTVFGSQASKFGLTSGMKMISFAGKNVLNMNSDKVREMIREHTGTTTIVFKRESIFDPDSARLKPFPPDGKVILVDK